MEITGCRFVRVTGRRSSTEHRALGGARSTGTVTACGEPCGIAAGLFLLVAGVFCQPVLAGDPPRNVTRFEARDDGLTLQCGEDVLLVRALAENIVEVHLRPRGQAGRDTLVLAPGRSGPYPWTWKDNPEAITGQTKRVQIRLTKQPLTLTVLDSNGKLILADKGSLGAQAVTFSHAAGHRFYGVLARGGREIQLRNGSHKVSAGRQGTGGGPFLWTTAGYGLLWDSDGGTVDLADRSVAITASRSDMRVFVLTGGPREIISAQARLAGYPPLFPKFAHGFMNTEWGIDQKELLNDVATYRRKGIPIDMFILDYDWFGYGQDNWGDFTWNDKNFPDGASGKLCKEILAAQGMKIATIRKPRLGGNTVQRDDAIQKGFLRLHKDRQGKEAPGNEFNYSTQAARDWWWEHSKIILDSGVAGYWNDEADGCGNYHFMEMQMTYYEGQRKATNQRVWSTNRNFYLGSQRYAYSTWTGDIRTGFPSMANQTGWLLTMGNIGQPWWAMDIGGFAGRPNEENYARWMQFGAFAPVYRVHGTRGQEREPWNYGAKAEAVATEFIKLRYRLLPYIYSCAWETTRTGVSICRPLIYDYPDDPEAANLGTEWLFGDCFLVCPVLAEQAESVEVYLPVGDWIDYWTGERHQGPKKLSRRLDMETWEDMGLFVKSGAIIPTAPAMNYVGERPVTALTVDIYPGSRPSRFLYYDDDGETYDYERGVYMAVPFACAPTEGKVGFSIGKPEGTFEASLISYVLQFRLVGRPAGGVALNGQALEQKANPEQVLESKQAWTFTEGRDGGTLVVKVPARQESRIETDAGMGPRSGTRAPRSGR